MEITAKDIAGIVLVAVTTIVLVSHVGPDHSARHPADVADAGGSVTSDAATHVTAFVDFNVVPMDSERILRRQVVIVEGDRIARIGPVGTLAAPPGATIVQGNGSDYLSPGLTDAHVHLPGGAEDWLPLFVANGVTTVFNLRGEARHLELRDRIAAGDVVGPTLFTSGPFTNEPAVRTPDQAVATVRQQADRGYDFVKVHGDLTLESFQALVEAGREEGIPVIGHTPRNLDLEVVLEARMPGIVHAEELIYTGFPTLDETGVEDVAADMAMAGTWLTPTLSTFGNIETQWGTEAGLEAGLASPEARFLPESMLRAWREDNPYLDRNPEGRERIRAMFEFQHTLIRVLHDAGIPMLSGTDAPLPVMAPGFSLHDELQALTRAGLTHYEALVTATRNAGLFVRQHVDRDSHFGTLVEGARADIVVSSRNPLLDVGALRHPEGVMLRGRYWDASGLTGLLAARPIT